MENPQVKMNPKTARLLKNGLGKVARGNFKAAIDEFSKVIKLQPEVIDAYLFRGNAYIDLGEYQRALPDLDYAIQENPQYGAAYYNRSIARMALGQADLALPDLDEAIRLEPDERGYYLHRSIVHSFRKEYEAALEDAAKVIELGDARAGHNNRAVIFEKMDSLPSAIAEWTKVLEIDSKNAKAYCRRGILLAMIGNRDGAIDDLNHGLKYKKELPDPLKEKAENILQELTGIEQK